MKSGSEDGAMGGAGLAPMLERARGVLLGERNGSGVWEGELSASALSTATAVGALAMVDGVAHEGQIAAGLGWLVEHQNGDGGWGDTVASLSNLSTTLLAWSAFGIAAGVNVPGADAAQRRAREWVQAKVGSLEPDLLARAVVARYGRDRTFSVPILMMCALGGRLGDEGRAWRRVLPLPFELAACPRRWFAALRLPVVSYALPALIAIGYARSRKIPPPFPLRQLRRLAWRRAGRLLGELQPRGGGFLEATPLTSFITMALVSAGEAGHEVVARAEGFLVRSMREEGSWPIDTNLSTWCTSLASKALLAGEVEAGNDAGLGGDDRRRIGEWLLGQQYLSEHIYTGSPPGGWAWTDLEGGVPDADDTPGAMVALWQLGRGGRWADGAERGRLVRAAELGSRWLRGLQNRDGGIPTFCRGWGKLPFDRSSADLTAHALRAWECWRGEFSGGEAEAVAGAMGRALGYLRGCQRADGSWLPLWFGNEKAEGEGNPCYGTAMVVRALCALDGGEWEGLEAMRGAGLRWLLGAQDGGGGWGGDRGLVPSLEETGVALAAVAEAARRGCGGEGQGQLRDAMGRAVGWLGEATAGGRRFPAAPIGFYFAKLWYFERLYPQVWVVEALELARAAGVE